MLKQESCLSGQDQKGPPWNNSSLKNIIGFYVNVTLETLKLQLCLYWAVVYQEADEYLNGKLSFEAVRPQWTFCIKHVLWTKHVNQN